MIEGLINEAAQIVAEGMSKVAIGFAVAIPVVGIIWCAWKVKRYFWWRGVLSKANELEKELGDKKE